jgi:hypothetical protein
MGFGIGNSKSTTNVEESNSGFEDLSGNASVTNIQGVELGAKSTLNLTDNGATKSAFEFANTQSSQAYDFSRDVSSKTASQITNALNAVSASAKSETQDIISNLQKYALYGAIIWGVVQIFKAAR